MDISLVTGAVTAIKTARELGAAALQVRDFNKFAGTIAEINEQLLRAQDSLFAHNADMMELQQKYFDACEELRKLKQVASERARYSLHEIGSGVFAYRFNGRPEDADEPANAEPLHYLCQPCFDQGVKSVLQDLYDQGPQSLRCNVCDTSYHTGVVKPYPAI